MLIYNPAQDCYNAIFRILQITEGNKQHVFDMDKIRILDFYLLFPGEISKLKFPRNLVPYKAEFKKYANPYANLENPARIFHELEPLQISAIYCLASRNIIDIDLLSKNRIIKRTSVALDPQLASAVNVRNSLSGNLVHFLSNELVNVALMGPGGLKDRSGLLEYKYDLF